MMHKKQVLTILLFSALGIALLFPMNLEAASCKVLVVFSYHPEYVWQQEVKEGIDRILGKTCEMKYFSLDMKINHQNGPQKAKEAFKLYQKFKPDGVITVDDAAQDTFVVPYLKDKIKTPVVFCGVNRDAEDYGFPASNVTGVLERFHTRETISLLQQLVPNAKTIGFIMRGNDESTVGIFRQVKEEASGYSLKAIGFWAPVTYEEALETTRQLKGKADVLWVDHMEGLKDKNGRPYSNKELIKEMAALWGNSPTACGQEHTVRYDCLCTVVESGIEQGMTAAKMLMKAMNGTPVSEIPITRNYTGFKVINASVMKKLGLNPRPVILQGAKLVTNEE